MRAQKLVLGLCATAIILGRLGQGILANYDDCYYAQKAKEMLEGGDWLTPHFAGRVTLDNPPLFLWMIAIGFRVFGIGKLGAAFFSGVAGVAAVLLLVRVARKLGFDAFESWAAAAVLLTTQYFLKYTQHAMMDVVLTLFFLLALDGYLDTMNDKRSGWLRVGIFTGLGVLMKSVLGLFPWIVVTGHRLAVRGRPALYERGPWIAATVAAVVAAPWYAYQLSVHPDQLVAEHFQWLILSRGLGDPGREAVDSGLFGYLTRIARVYWPWLPFALYGLWLEAKRALARGAETERWSVARLLLIWVGVVVGIMSIGHVKKLWYVMTVFPCLALLSARAIGHLAREPRARQRILASAAVVLVILGATIALTPIGKARPRQPGLHRIALAAKDTLPAGEKVLNLDAFYWDVANLFLFYSGHDLTEPVGSAPRLREALHDGGWALVPSLRVAEVIEAEPASFIVVARSDDWALIRRAAPR